MFGEVEALHLFVQEVPVLFLVFLLHDQLRVTPLDEQFGRLHFLFCLRRNDELFFVGVHLNNIPDAFNVGKWQGPFLELAQIYLAISQSYTQFISRCLELDDS